MSAEPSLDIAVDARANESAPNRPVIARTRRIALMRRMLALGAGALLACAFAPLEAWPLAIVCPAALMALWDGTTPRHAAALGFWFGFGTFAAGTYWLYVAIHTVGHAPIWITLLVTLGLMGLMAAYHALTGYVVVRFLPAGPVRWLLGAPVVWLLLEWLRGWLLSGFPWLSLGYTQTGTALAHLAPIAGVYGISLVLLSSAGALVALARGTLSVRLIAAAVLTVPWLVCAVLGDIAWTHPAGAPVPVAIVQGNISQQDKWQAALSRKILARYQRLTQSALGTRLIVWPESALPDLINNLLPYVARLDREARAHGSSWVLGTQRAAVHDGHYDYYNSILALGRQASWYDKVHLVPLTEYIPLPRFVRRWLGRMNLPSSSFTPGALSQRPLPVAGLELGPTVCYEVAYGGYMLRMLPEANVLLNVTDDAWFGNTPELAQQFQMARMRALEEGRDMIVATDDGVSGVIGPQGQVIARAPIMVPYVLRSQVTPMAGMTPFARVGNGLAVGLSCLGLAAALAMRRRRT